MTQQAGTGNSKMQKMQMTQKMELDAQHPAEQASAPEELLPWVGEACVKLVEQRLRDTQHRRDVAGDYRPAETENSCLPADAPAEHKKLAKVFLSMKVPLISLSDYCRRLQRYMKASPESWVMALEYLNRVCEVPEEWVRGEQERVLRERLEAMQVSSVSVSASGAEQVGDVTMLAANMVAGMKAQVAQQHGVASDSSFASQHGAGSLVSFGAGSDASTMMSDASMTSSIMCGASIASTATFVEQPLASATATVELAAAQQAAPSRPLPAHKLPAHQLPMSKLPFTERTAHRLVFTAMVVATKQQDDFFWTNKFYGQCGGVDTKSVNEMELAFLKLLKWKSHVTAEVFESQLDACKAVSGFRTAAEERAVEQAAADAFANANVCVAVQQQSPKKRACLEPIPEQEAAAFSADATLARRWSCTA